MRNLKKIAEAQLALETQPLERHSFWAVLVRCTRRVCPGSIRSDIRSLGHLSSLPRDKWEGRDSPLAKNPRQELLSERRDLNPRPPRPKRGALPGCATFRLEARNLRQEPRQSYKESNEQYIQTSEESQNGLSPAQPQFRILFLTLSP
jgi:hypothetical protein